MATPTVVTAKVLPAHSSSPNNVSRYVAPTFASAVIAITVAICTTQPPESQPTLGPNARVVHTNVVPQSGISRFSSRNANAVNKIGTNPSSRAAGARSPTTMTTSPRVTAMLYAGATADRPSATAPIRPTELRRSPLSVVALSEAALSGAESSTVTGGDVDWMDMGVPLVGPMCLLKRNLTTM